MRSWPSPWIRHWSECKHTNNDFGTYLATTDISDVEHVCVVVEYSVWLRAVRCLWRWPPAHQMAPPHTTKHRSLRRTWRHVTSSSSGAGTGHVTAPMRATFVLLRHSLHRNSQYNSSVCPSVCLSVCMSGYNLLRRAACRWLASVTVRTLDLWSWGRGFNSRSGRSQVVTTWMVTACRHVNHLGI